MHYRNILTLIQFRLLFRHRVLQLGHAPSTLSPVRKSVENAHTQKEHCTGQRTNRVASQVMKKYARNYKVSRSENTWGGPDFTRLKNSFSAKFSDFADRFGPTSCDYFINIAANGVYTQHSENAEIWIRDSYALTSWVPVGQVSTNMIATCRDPRRRKLGRYRRNNPKYRWIYDPDLSGNRQFCQFRR